MRIGVLALQGSFREHINALRRCGVDTCEIRLPSMLKKVDGLIMPGGESTTISKLMIEYDFPEEMKNFFLSGKPIFGTCAGAILLADSVGGKKQDLLNLIDIDIERNAYGRQLASREIELDIKCMGPDPFRAIFIRAPIIESLGPNVLSLADYRGKSVMARQKNVMVSTFHPELTEDTRVHEYFIGMAAGRHEI
jgi:5'-phosphate synthase pdxT subunit